MRYNWKVAILFALILVSLISVFLSELSKGERGHLLKLKSNETPKVYNVWVVFTRVEERRSQATKLDNMLSTMLYWSSVPISLHLIVDQQSEQIARQTVETVYNSSGKHVQLRTYDIRSVIGKIEDVVAVMKPYFSPKAGSYYSDSLFYISLGLDRVASPSISSAVLLDVDLRFQSDIAFLFQQFDRFSDSQLFGLAPELAPVYYHLLAKFRRLNSGRQLDIGLPCCAPLPASTSFPSVIDNSTLSAASKPEGEQVSLKVKTSGEEMVGRPGLNSGVVLLRLDRIRTSLLFQTITTSDFVSSLVNKYYFKGHLGDQDLYSLLSWEMPSLVKTLDCGWNRQLCTWWRDHGYQSVHSAFSYCPTSTKIYHANYCPEQGAAVCFFFDCRGVVYMEFIPRVKLSTRSST